jgi:16S rRNA (guanine966-N2)-methyltransferase
LVVAARKKANNKKSQAGQLRIVAGIWRSRLLRIADVAGLRPTAERIRETLFNWLAPRIEGARCLDVCAGTGALGIEALSRGASEVVFVEKSTMAARVLQENLQTLGAKPQEILHQDALDYLRQRETRLFDIVFVDPPFAADLHAELCRLLEEREWLAPDCRIYIEMDKVQSELALPSGWNVLKDKTAGNVRYLLVSNDL